MIKQLVLLLVAVFGQDELIDVTTAVPTNVTAQV